MRGELVPALSRVEDEDAPPRARQLQGRCKARIAPTDDDDVVHGNSLLLSAVGALTAEQAAPSANAPPS